MAAYSRNYNVMAVVPKSQQFLITPQ